MLGYLLGFNSETILDSIDFSKTDNLTYLGLTTYHYSVNKPPDADTLNIFRGASHVQTYRVDGYSFLTQSPSRPATKEELPAVSKDSMIDGLLITACGPTFGKSFANQLSGVVSDSKSYGRDGKKCIMIPGVVFRVWNGKTFADVVLCFHCGQVVIFGYDNTGKEMSSTSGTIATTGFARLVKIAFPKDSVLQKL
jgi:hypothetical protein